MMKKIFLIALILACFSAAGQSYTYIGNRYEWLGGLFRALGVPAGDGPAAFQTGQRIRAGAIYYDSTGVDSGLYVYSGLAWLKQGGTTTLPGEGLTESGDSLHLGGLIGSASKLYNERGINTNRKIIHFTNGIEPEAGGQLWQFSKRPYSPFQFISSDTVTSNAVNAPSVANPLSSVFARRIIYMADGISRTPLESYGHEFTQTFSFQDSINIPTSGGDYNQALIGEYRLKPRNNGTAVVQTGSNSIYNNNRKEALAAVVGNMYADGKSDSGSDSLHVKGSLSGVTSYLVASNSPGKIEVDNVIFFKPDFLLATGGTTKIRKMYYFASTDRQIPALAVDSAYGWFDTSQRVHSYHAGNYVFGRGAVNASTDKIRVYGNIHALDVSNKSWLQADPENKIIAAGDLNNFYNSTQWNLNDVSKQLSLVAKDGMVVSLDASANTLNTIRAQSTQTIDDSLYLPNTGNTSDTLATLKDVRENGGGGQNLQDVTDEGNSTTNAIIAPTFESLTAGKFGLGVISSAGYLQLSNSSDVGTNIKPQAAGVTTEIYLPTGAGIDTLFTFRDFRDNGGGGSAPSLTQYRLAIGNASNQISDNAAITGNRAIKSDANGAPIHSTVTDTELERLSGVDDNVQDQIDRSFTLTLQGLSVSAPGDNFTRYFSTYPAQWHTSENTYELEVPYNCTLQSAQIYLRCTTTGTNETISVYVRNTTTSTDNLVASLSSTDNIRLFQNTNMNVSFTAGQRYIIKIVVPTMATDMATCIPTGFLKFK